MVKDRIVNSYKKVKFYFFYDLDDINNSFGWQSLISLRASFYAFSDSKEATHSEVNSYTSEQIEKYFIPIISIKKGYDPITSSLLYLNDDYCKGFFKRFIDEGTDWFDFSGIKVFPDGTWRIET